MEHAHPMHDGATVVLHTGGLNWATEQNVVEGVSAAGRAFARSTPTRSRRRRPSPSTRSARPSRTFEAGSATAAALRRPVGPEPHLRPDDGTAVVGRPRRNTPGAPAAAMPTPHDMMGHGGHAGMSMAGMVADMRNRFLVAALFSIPILLWSPIGRDVLGFGVAGAVRAARRRLAS